MTMKKLFVTGAGGYIGSIATYLYLQKGYEVVALDNFQTGYREPLELLQSKYGKEKLRMYDLNLTGDISPLFTAEKEIDAVIHYAASCLVDESMKNPYKYFYNNVIGTLNLLDQLDNNGIQNIVFSSTCATYGEAQYVPIDEKHRTVPFNTYGESKLMAENVIRRYGQTKGLKYMILRYFNVCGASDDGLIGDSKKPSALLVQNAVRGALGIEPFKLVCPTVDTPDKTPIRDFINVMDLNEAHLSALEYLTNGGASETLNIGTGTGNSVLEIVEKVKQVTGVSFEIENSEPRQGDPPKLIASVDKVKQVLGWQPKRTIEDSIKSLVIWYKAHPNGWSK